MSSPQASMKNAARTAERKGQQIAAQPWVEKLARFGYGAVGVVYIVIGVLATQAAFGVGGKVTDVRGALREILTAPFGQIALTLIAIGLLGYAIWRFVQAIMDPEHKGDDAKGIALRTGYFIIGLIYTGFALTAFGMVIGSSNTSGGSTSQQSLVARAFAFPGGRWLVGIVGLIVIGVGLYEFYKAYKQTFRKRFAAQSAEIQHWLVRIGQIGLSARGVVFVMIGWLLIQAALTANPNRAAGQEGAMQHLLGSPFGPLIFGIVAIGLIAFGIYKIAEGWYGRLETPSANR